MLFGAPEIIRFFPLEYSSEDDKFRILSLKYYNAKKGVNNIF